MVTLNSSFAYTAYIEPTAYSDVLTIVGTYFRGPNWVFYWSPADWPHH